jgi:hypothetical protein
MNFKVRGERSLCLQTAWNSLGMAEEYHGYICAEPRYKPRNFQVQGKGAAHSTVPFSVSLCCVAIASCRFRTASKFSSLLFIITFTQFSTTPENVRNPMLNLGVPDQ